MKPIYKPKGREGEYGERAINIYTGCNHGCTYCYAAKMAKRFGKDFTDVRPREGVVEATKKQIEKEGISDQLIHLCFTCDPYPADIDTTVTREIIKVIKESGNHVQILTKAPSRAKRDWDLLDEKDWFGVSVSGGVSEEPNADDHYKRITSLQDAKEYGVKTWISCEPVIDPSLVYVIIQNVDKLINYDMIKIGKMNHEKSYINWGAFGHKCENLCQEYERNYYIKEDLRKEMDKFNT